jgi:uncharacterized membrane-anchored protein
MKHFLTLPLFALLVVAQLAVPAWMITSRERTLRDGEVYKFKTAPVDPYDPFRGRYVALGVEPNEAPLPKGANLNRNQKVFAVLDRDEEGFTKVSELSLARPEDDNYIQVKVAYVSNASATLRWPFDRYYMDEHLAPKAEAAYRSNSRGENRNAHLMVRVRNGAAVLEELYIEDVPISDYIRQATFQ